ncbi:MAG: hypothetical protein IMX04_01950 [Candidatus Carbobacillus altaicus]|uniref:Toluene-4-monooxygenase, subunit TmoA n=1 Tax=Candidatus Carbonibacillus altaicus TaxID=2163959 RepID=A0A2R6Y0M2_9BACL|nr:hypothetical protein [Candidatus Carbobacillus altaicus]PTQ56182.1 MAG: Toluene-4-monooxygenase, subunit TmoA [Candidatus Carbobacillus altaicus]
MPKLDRAAYYDLTRDMNWHFKYVPFEAAFPAEMVYNPDVPLEEWWTWDEPYK